MIRTITALLMIPLGLGAVTLQEVFDSAPAGTGYDKEVTLTGGEIYTGGIAIMDQKVAIHGNGALIDLQGGSITVTNSVLTTTRLDIDHCVLVNGTNALDYSNSANGHIVNNTFYGNSIGVKIYYCSSDSSSIINCIFSDQSEFAVLCRIYYYPSISYNCCYNNSGDYIDDCG